MTSRKTKIVQIDINPWIKLIWISRLPAKLPRGYTGGFRVRQYRHTVKRVNAIWDLAGNWNWTQDNNGYHLCRL